MSPDIRYDHVMSEFISLPVADGTSMDVFVARPPSAADQPPGVIVLQEAFGVNAHIQDVALRFAARGCVAMAPELFHRTAPGFQGDYADFRSAMPHIQAMTIEGQQYDLRAVHGWLTAQHVGRVVAAGFCLGGRAALVAAATLPLGAAAAFYGGSLLTLRDHFSSVAAPLLLVWGDRDKHIPPSQRAEVAALLRQEKKDFVECTFSRAGHGFFCDQRPSFDPYSARLAWRLLLEFLDA